MQPTISPCLRAISRGWLSSGAIRCSPDGLVLELDELTPRRQWQRFGFDADLVMVLWVTRAAASDQHPGYLSMMTDSS